MITIHPLRTGSLRIRKAQYQRRSGGPVRVLLDSEWTEWLPIYAWAIEHPEGVIVVDTGVTARAGEPAHFPRWHPYYRTSLEVDVRPDEEIGPQLQQVGIDPDDVEIVVLTHLHPDHTGGLHYFPNSMMLVARGDYRLARSAVGKLLGYLPHHWPPGFQPEAIPFMDERIGPFLESLPLTDAGDVVIVPTPGHTPHHVSVIVRTDELDFFLAGDASYTQDALRWRTPDGITLTPSRMAKTHELILIHAVERPTVYLPSHDPDAERRLKEREILPAAPDEA